MLGAAGCFFLLAALGGAAGLFAMESNVPVAWATGSSGPLKAELCFYSKQSDDLMFDQQETIEIICRAGARSVGLKWGLSRNCFAKSFLTGDAEARPANLYVIRIATANLAPGFYDIHASLDVGEAKPIDSICTFGWRADKVVIPQTRPADFTSFWDKAKAELAQVKLDASTGPVQVFNAKEIGAYNVAHAALPAEYDPAGHRAEEVEAFKVDFASVGGMRIHGWVAKPKGDGPFPVMLVLPGGGIAARTIPLEHARHGYLAMDIQIHGQEVDLAKYPSVPGYFEGQVYDPPTDNYYYKVHLHCLQAINYLLSRPDADASRFAVVGGSQGGRLAVVVAALDPRVKAIVPAIPHFADYPYVRWTEDCNGTRVKPHKPPVDGMDQSQWPPVLDDAETRCMAYYDIMNFAPDVKCPVFMNMGLIDPISTATGSHALWRRLGSPDKHLILLPGMAHDWSAEFDRQAWRWLEKTLKIKGAP